MPKAPESGRNGKRLHTTACRLFGAGLSVSSRLNTCGGHLSLCAWRCPIFCAQIRRGGRLRQRMPASCRSGPPSTAA
eukprot:8469980-Alexandrium_andersonii.AAC.1